MSSRIPLSTMLSWVLVAFTIEVDNAFEEAMPHTTASKRRTGQPAEGPWLVSLPMWYSVMQFVPPDGVTIGEVERQSFGAHSLRGSNPGMVRWRYVTVDPDPNHGGRRARVSDWLVRATDEGRRAQAIWRPLPAVVETRWIDRYGVKTASSLRRSLTALVEQIDQPLPDYLLVNAAHSGRVELGASVPSNGEGQEQDLVVLVAKTLTAFTLDYERDSDVSLVLAANLLRAIGSDNVAARELPQRTGVARETLNVMIGSLRRQALIVDEPKTAKTVRLTPSGRAALDDYYGRIEDVETQWRSRFGARVVDGLRAALEKLVGDLDLASSPLALAIEPRPTGWRARSSRPTILPHHPVVSHRGGYPDGS